MESSFYICGRMQTAYSRSMNSVPFVFCSFLSNPEKLIIPICMMYIPCEGVSMDFKDFFKAKIRVLRGECGETQMQVAKAIGVSVRYYQNLELGENMPGIERFIALADHFGVSLEYLAGRSEVRKP